MAYSPLARSHLSAATRHATPLMYYLAQRHSGKGCMDEGCGGVSGDRGNDPMRMAQPAA